MSQQGSAVPAEDEGLAPPEPVHRALSTPLHATTARLDRVRDMESRLHSQPAGDTESSTDSSKRPRLSRASSHDTAAPERASVSKVSFSETSAGGSRAPKKSAKEFLDLAAMRKARSSRVFNTREFTCGCAALAQVAPGGSRVWVLEVAV